MRHSIEFVALCDDAKARIREVTLPQYLEDPRAWTLVDVREESEFERFEVPGSVHLGKGILERDAVQRFGLDTPVLLMCGGGYRSALAADALQQMGFTRVASLAGGIKGWWRHVLLSASSGGTVPGLSVRERAVVQGDLHVQGDLEVLAPLRVDGHMHVDGLLEATAALRCGQLTARAAIVTAQTSVAGRAAVEWLLGDLDCAELRARRIIDHPLPPAFAQDPADALRAWARGRLTLSS